MQTLQSAVFDPAAPQPGRYAGVPEAAYFAAPALNASTLKQMVRSPAHCRAYLDAASRPDTEAQLVGRMVHCAVLEPARFATDYCPAPELSDYPHALTDAESYKAAAKALGEKVSGTKAELRARIEAADRAGTFVFWDNLLAELVGGRSALKPAHWAMGQAIMAALAANPKALAALSRGAAEETLVWQDALSGLLCKGRLDYYREDLGVVFDVKTTEDARPFAVERDLVKWGYHLSAAHYLAGLRARGLPGDSFAWIFIEKAAPHAMGLYFASPALLDTAEGQRRRLLDAYAACQTSGVWPGYPGEFQTIDLPVWARD